MDPAVVHVGWTIQNKEVSVRPPSVQRLPEFRQYQPVGSMWKNGAEVSWTMDQLMNTTKGL